MDTQDATIQARRNKKRNRRGPWASGGAMDGETDLDTETDGGISLFARSGGSSTAVHVDNKAHTLLTSCAEPSKPYSCSSLLIQET